MGLECYCEAWTVGTLDGVDDLEAEQLSRAAFTRSSTALKSGICSEE